MVVPEDLAIVSYSLIRLLLHICGRHGGGFEGRVLDLVWYEAWRSEGGGG